MSVADWPEPVAPRTGSTPPDRSGLRLVSRGRGTVYCLPARHPEVLCAAATKGEKEIDKSPDELTAEEQTAILAGRYSERAEAYDALWSPVIRPIGERLLGHLPLSRARNIVDVGTGSGALLPLIQKASPSAIVLGVDNSEGMLRLAKDKHPGPLALMDVQKLELDDDQFDVAVVAFVLFHLPQPERCLEEVNRVLRAGGVVGTATWGAEHIPLAEAIWDEELEASGAHVPGLPAADNRACCDSPEKVANLFAQAGFASTRTWTESLHHQWRPEDFFEYQLRGAARIRLLSLAPDERDRCVKRVRDRLSGQGEDQFVFRGEVVLATGVKADIDGSLPPSAPKPVATEARGRNPTERHFLPKGLSSASKNSDPWKGISPQAVDQSHEIWRRIKYKVAKSVHQGEPDLRRHGKSRLNQGPRAGR